MLRSLVLLNTSCKPVMNHEALRKHSAQPSRSPGPHSCACLAECSRALTYFKRCSNPMSAKPFPRFAKSGGDFTLHGGRSNVGPTKVARVGRAFESHVSIPAQHITCYWPTSAPSGLAGGPPAGLMFMALDHVESAIYKVASAFRGDAELKSL